MTIQTHRVRPRALGLALAALAFFMSISEPAQAGSFTNTGALTTARSQGHTATLLPSGKVLVAGGWQIDNAGNYDYLASAELYDPATGTWTATGDLAGPRTFHTATLLSDGRVLVAGGKTRGADGYGQSIATAELYDPATGIWTPTGDMTGPHAEHKAALLPGGRVLVAGGWGDGLDGRELSTARAELYDPATGIWTATGSLRLGRTFDHTATLLLGGNVLVTGGISKLAVRSAELYDFLTGTWTATGSMTVARYIHTAVLLQNGMVLVVGGVSNSGINPYKSAERYDPLAGTWAATGAMSVGRVFHTTTLLADGKVLVAGGTEDLVTPHFTSELYDPAAGTWSIDGPMITGRYFHTATLLADGRVLFVGGKSGYDDVVTRDTAELYDPGAVSVTAIRLTDATRLPNGAFQFGFTNRPGGSFSVYAAADPSVPLTNWTALGGVPEISPGQFQFTDPQAAGSSMRFYRVLSP